MGCFDTFYNKDQSVEVQLKCGPCLLNVYAEGEHLDEAFVGRFPDALYRGSGGFGWVRIEKNTVISVTEECPEVDLPHLDNHGGIIRP
jgi:hypothetical protein